MKHEHRDLQNEEVMIDLTDVNDETMSFRLIDEITVCDQKYAILEDPEDEGSVLIFQVETNDEEETFIAIEDDEVMEKVFYLWQADQDDYEIGNAE